jgi:hypothetical protein
MSTAPLATAPEPTLADAVDESLVAAFAGRPAECLWCGAAEVLVVSTDIWSGRVKTRCACCGSELSGVVPRAQREVRP